MSPTDQDHRGAELLGIALKVYESAPPEVRAPLRMELLRSYITHAHMADVREAA